MSGEGLTADEVRVLKAFAAFLMRGSAFQAGARPPAANGGASGGTTGAMVPPAANGVAGARGGGRIASPGELATKYGDSVVKKDPKRWVGISYAGAPMSRCPSDYLYMLADYLDWQGDADMKKEAPPRHSNGTPYYEYKFKDAGLARAWAKRNEGKAMAPPPPPEHASHGSDDPESAPYDPSAHGEDDIPF